MPRDDGDDVTTPEAAPPATAGPDRTRTPRPHERLIVALDLPTLAEAEELAGNLAGEVGWFKVGLELFAAHGPDAVRVIAAHGPVFLDLKLHDIPTTVERSAARIAGLGARLVTVHAGGGPAMVAAAVSGLGDAAEVLAVTVLTSTSDTELAALGQDPASVQVPRLARLAVDAGAPGLVCAPRDLAAVRDAVGPTPRLVTPGIRPAAAGIDDHARSATPARAIADGADLLVVGRPITRADDPRAAARAIAAGLD